MNQAISNVYVILLKQIYSMLKLITEIVKA